MNNEELKVQIALGTIGKCIVCGELYSTTQLKAVQSRWNKKFYFICIICIKSTPNISDILVSSKDRSLDRSLD
jgi:hypothetical protein